LELDFLPFNFLTPLSFITFEASNIFIKWIYGVIKSYSNSSAKGDNERCVISQRKNQIHWVFSRQMLFGILKKDFGILRLSVKPAQELTTFPELFSLSIFCL
jgi:hypothetical protein